MNLKLPRTFVLLPLPSFCIHSIAYLVCIIYSTSALRGNETNRLALLDFRAKISQDPLRAFDSWNDTVHFCKWYGVTCGQRHQMVTMLNLSSLHLSGTISPSISNLSFLTALDLSENNLVGEIPPQLGRLSKLRYLYLDDNSLAGEMPPNISSCSNLVAIVFSNNSLEGPIPTEFGTMTKVKRLSLGNNHLKGIIPPSLGNMSSLQVLSLWKNNLAGILPASLGKLMNLHFLSLFENGISGIVPISIFNLSSLTDLDLGINYFNGTLPSNLGILLPNLKFLSVGQNLFTGSIPVSISNASNLDTLELNYNSFSGKVPSLQKLVNLRMLIMGYNHLGTGQADDLTFLSSLVNATVLEVLGISTNNFGGTIYKEIGNLSSRLSEFYLESNQIAGGIPNEVGNLVNLQRFAAWDNKFSGSIPANIGKLRNIHILRLDENNFTGYIPSSVGNLTNLLILHLGINGLQGNIPSSLLNCNKLMKLDLSRNRLDGIIPPEITTLSSLSIDLNLSNNHLVGVLPEEIGALKLLALIDVSYNMLSGEIPSTLGSCESLEMLDLSKNFFQGFLPSSLSSLKGLLLFDVSSNNLSGEIPDFLEGFKLLENLNLSNNNFEGAVPAEGIFRNASAVSVVGNPKLCGGVAELKLPGCNFSKPRKIITRTVKIALTTICGLLSVAIVISCTLVYRARGNKREAALSYNLMQLPKWSYQSLLRATNEFSSSNLIGSGGFATVYRGLLDSQGTLVAVKVFNLVHHGASQSFTTECEILRNIRHRNIVKVLSTCSSIDSQGNDFKALICEFMTNGCLEEWLHPSQSLHRTPRFLNFIQRLNISIDVACALEYLHHQCGATIVHCDLKPSNVLLDDELVGHVSDFGLSKFLQEKTSQRQTSQSTSIGLGGTIGYAPPEYGMGGNISVYGDTYSYGILLLEIFTGKRPTDPMFKDGLTLRSFVESALPEHIAEVADAAILRTRSEAKKLAANINDHNSSYEILKCLIMIFRIGVSCSVESPGDRMNIHDVVAQLSFMRSQLLTGEM